jgi:peptidyl-dipeptidase Dcp
MRKLHLQSISVGILISVNAYTTAFCQVKNRVQSGASMQREIMKKEAELKNPLLAEWSGSYGGVPPFDKIKVSDFVPALTKAMELKRNEIGKIASNTEKPDFENTIAALERAGQVLNRASTIYSIWSSSLNGPGFEKVEAEMEPKLAAFNDEITQNTALFKRIETIYNSPEKKKLSPEQQRLVWRRYMTFVLDGATLEGDAKTRVSAINQELAGLFTKFNQNLLADEGDLFMEIKSADALSGLPQGQIDAAKAQAVSKKLPDSWVIANTRSSIDPFLTYSSNRELREKAWKMFINRGDNGDAHDNNGIIPKILKLRAERAKLLGYPTHAHWRLANTMAKTPEKAMELMEGVWTPALQLVKKEVADMQSIADKEGAGIKIEAWDYRFYAEKVRKEKYDLDQNEVKQYLQMEKLKQGMFWMAGELFNLSFTEVKDVPVFNPDMQVWKVSNKTTGKLVGLWYFDPYARQGKRSGAWMNSHRDQHRMDGKEVPTIVSNNSNFIKGNPGEPVLISWDDAETLFHEFGHALHGLCSDVTYPTLSGTNVAQDYVEFPSQILERWLSTKEVMEKFALHYETGKPIPQALVDKINNASKFNQGFQTVEATASALIDMKLHLMGDADIDPDAFEKNTLEKMGMPKEIVMRHRTPQFGHIFSSDGYSAGYYSYLWSDVISADAWEAFTEAGGAYDKTVGKKLHKFIFSVGNTIDQGEAYRKFRGRDPKTDALMRSRGL